MSPSTRRVAATLSFVAMLAGCAAAVPVRPATMAPLAGTVADLVVPTDVPIRLSTGYTRTLPQQSRWRAVGTLAEGTVYQPVNSVFAIEGRNVHEAYLVVQSGSLRGFYLPAENNFSPLATPLSLPPATGVQR
jgi:hypothetical protein